jgi:hypothetical protein
MKPFLPISLPEFIPYELFKAQSGMHGDSDDVVLERGICAIAEARKNLESYLAKGPYLSINPEEDDNQASASSSGFDADWVKDVKDSLRACIGASLAINAVGKALASAAPSSRGAKPNRRPEKLFLTVDIPESGSKARWHDWWAVPRLSDKLPIRPAPAPQRK